MALPLLGSALAALVAGHWIRYRLAHGPCQLLGFLFLGPAQEELLFRGALYELVERSRLPAGPGAPVFLSTLFFALHHLQLYGFAMTSSALAQVGFAVPMGVALGLLRAESQSLWPGWPLTS